MNLFKSLSTSVVAAFWVTTAAAAPLCEQFVAQDRMPDKYKKLAPVISGSPTDWIITHDQMDTVYAPNDEATMLLSGIAQEFERRGVALAILMPPPRPLVAGQEELDRLTGGASDFDTASVAASFDQMVVAMNAAGVIAPNLLRTATRDEAIRQAYYYRQDTHWTPEGAAESAYALAEAVVAANHPSFAGIVPQRGEIRDDADTHTEAGSLAKMTAAVCGAELAPVVTAIPAFETGDGDLLGDNSDKPQIILAGSSFSNRYGNDAYRVADAIAGTLGAEVANHSVSGGGAIGGIEGIVLSGLVSDQSGPDMVVWELPYTEGIRNISALRQLHGALRYDPLAPGEKVALAAGDKATFDLAHSDADLLTIHMIPPEVERMKLDLRFTDGSKKTLKLVRKKHVPAHLRSDIWAVSLAGYPLASIESATLRHGSKKVPEGAFVTIYPAAPGH